MNIDILLDVLQDAGLGTIGVNLFKDHLPDTSTLGIMLRGPLQGIAISQYLPGYHKGTIQAVVRASKRDAGDALATQLLSVLNFYNRTWTDPVTGAFIMKINQIFPCALPIIYPRTPANLIEWSVSFDCSYVFSV